ncbi:MAG: substrate-binding domain-containing protein [Microthrixaceae bacterium]|nr:substrate-binding domain-containing protein [Microthrixaceae bacterium]
MWWRLHLERGGVGFVDRGADQHRRRRVLHRGNEAEGNEKVSVSVDGPGTGDGFELFCDGLTDINDASSKIKPEQIEACESNGVEFIELPIGNDGIVMMTSESNTAVKCLSTGDIYALAGPESQGFETWAEADELATEVGGQGDLPDAPLDLIGPGEESGTYVSFVELAIEDIAEERGQELQTRPDYQASADDNIIVQGVQGSATSLGWVGFAFAREAEDVTMIEVDDGDGCVAPTETTIADGTYPLSRPLFIYVNKSVAAENDSLVRFVDHYLGEAVDSVADVGYVALSDTALAETRERWQSRTQGAA